MCFFPQPLILSCVVMPSVLATPIQSPIFGENMPTSQEPINRSLHLSYKPSESTLSDEKLFIETVFGQNLSRPNA